jgi:hypothetical protein
MPRRIAILLLAASAPVAAQQADPPAPTPEIVVKGESSETKVVCRTELSTGSIMRKRVCKTQAQIADEKRQSQAALDFSIREQKNLEEMRRANQDGGGN